MGKMFPFITKTWNPLGGGCQHGCSYCWARSLANRRRMAKYIQATTYLDIGAMKKKFTKKDFVFVCSMNDLFGSWVEAKYIQAILDYIEKSPAQFLLLTKNPARYLEFNLPNNAVAGATIESNLSTIGNDNVPNGWLRILAMRLVKHTKMVSVEPIMDFDEDFPYSIVSVKPEFVAVGYDNYHNNLIEPSLNKTKDLIEVLKDWNIKVYEKTLREANS